MSPLTTTATSPTATEIAQKTTAGELSAREVVEDHIRRIESVNPDLNALVVPRFEEAREEAKAADAAQSRGDPLGPLHGVPITIKEQFWVEDTPTTLGVLNQKDRRATEDGPLVKRLRQAGAIILGKTNIPQLFVYFESDNPVYGRTNNPWNQARTCGGSSGGEAAIIAAHASPLGLADDLAGSIRIPAHFCGIQALKPTSYRLTNYDKFPDIAAAGLFPRGQEAVIPQPGPMARSVADLTLAMETLAAPGLEKIDPSIPPVPWPDPSSVDVNELRVALFTDDGYFEASPAIRRVVTEAGEALQAMGSNVEEWTPPDVEEAINFFFSIMTADGTHQFQQLLGSDEVMPQVKGILQSNKIPHLLRPLVATLIQATGQKRMAGFLRAVGKRSAKDFWELVDAKKRYRLRFLNTLDAGGYDVILCPPVAVPAAPHGGTVDLLGFNSYSILFNILGMPAGVVAASRIQADEESDRQPGKDKSEQAALQIEKGSAGLPVGVQVAARPWRDDVVLAVMGALERHFSSQPDYPAHPALAT
jgi:fatty acid amide hydrolase